MLKLNTQRLLLAASLLLVPVLSLAQQAGAIPIAPWQQGELDRAHMMTMRGIPLLFVLILVVVTMVFINQRDKRRQALIAMFIDKGQEVPQSLLTRPGSRWRELRRGTWLTSLGLGLGLVLYIATWDLAIAAWSLILLSLGAASFVNALLFYPPDDSQS